MFEQVLVSKLFGNKITFTKSNSLILNDVSFFTNAGSDQDPEWQETVFEGEIRVSESWHGLSVHVIARKDVTQGLEFFLYSNHLIPPLAYFFIDFDKI